MDAHRFDTIARLFGERRSRRQTLAQAGAGLAAGALAAAGLRAGAAQEATPPAVAAGEQTTFLFLQSFRSGSVAAKEDAVGRYTLTLEQGLGQTVYFSDRPERIVGASPTPEFLAGLGFSPGDPPNAALVVETEGGETEVAVVELFAPSYDEATRTATYEVAVLAEWERELGVDFHQAPTDLAGFGERFGAAHLFIDSCPPIIVDCLRDGVLVGSLNGGALVYQCAHGGGLLCDPCPDWPQQCNQQYPDCQGQCDAQPD
jgi:hypothetical protein